MKKLLSILLCVVLCLSLFGCGYKDGDLGNQTTVDEQNGYTVIQEVRTFQFKVDEKEIPSKENLRSEGFKVSYQNPADPIKTKSDAFDIALQEVTVSFNTMAAYFDKTRGYWKVVFSDVTETTDAEGKLSRTSVDKEVIYIDEDGYTFCAYTN